VETLDHLPLLPVLFLVALSGFFSASETALFSLSRFQIRQLKTKNQKLFHRIQHLLDRPAALVATVLIGNECANVLISHFMADFYHHAFPDQILFVTAINILTVMPLIFLVGEITPKILAARANMTVLPFLLPAFWFTHHVAFPLRWCIESIVNFLTKNIRKSSTVKDSSFHEEDFLHLVEDIKNKGAIERSEQELIENIFDLDDDNALELCTPLTEVLTIGQNESIASAILKLKKSYSARIPVLSGPDRVVGILYAKDLLTHLDREDSTNPVRQLMKEPLVIDPHMKAESLFKRFRQMRVHIAVIEDNQGRAKGVVTMEDILEQMFGELWEQEEAKT
jgi:putative hemolysin